MIIDGDTIISTINMINCIKDIELIQEGLFINNVIHLYGALEEWGTEIQHDFFQITSNLSLLYIKI